MTHFGLALHFVGDDWSGCGLNWKGWFPEDAHDDATKFNALTFQIREVSKSTSATLSVSLADNVKRAGGEAASNSIEVIASGSVEKIDGTWRRVVIPLESFTRNKPLQ